MDMCRSTAASWRRVQRVVLLSPGAPVLWNGLDVRRAVQGPRTPGVRRLPSEQISCTSFPGRNSGHGFRAGPASHTGRNTFVCECTGKTLPPAAISTGSVRRQHENVREAVRRQDRTILIGLSGRRTADEFKPTPVGISTLPAIRITSLASNLLASIMRFPFIPARIWIRRL